MLTEGKIVVWNNTAWCWVLCLRAASSGRRRNHSSQIKSSLISLQEPFATDTADVFINGLNAGAVSCSTLCSSDPLHSLNHNQFPTLHCGSSRSLNQNSDAKRQNIYENFMQELEMGCSSTADRTEPSEGDGDEGEEDEEEIDGDVEVGEGEQLDVLFEKEQGVVRRAGWLSFKPLITVNKDRKLELVARRKWRHYWVTLKGTAACKDQKTES